jgi:hypothetical protein
VWILGELLVDLTVTELTGFRSNKIGGLGTLVFLSGLDCDLSGVACCLPVPAASADTAFQKQKKDTTSAKQKSNRLMRLSKKEGYKVIRLTRSGPTEIRLAGLLRDVQLRRTLLKMELDQPCKSISVFDRLYGIVATQTMPRV